jgi:hypothetical protein
MAKSNIWLLNGPCPREALLSTGWSGVAVYDDMIVFRAGKSLLILDDNGLHVQAPDVVLNSTKDLPLS